MSQEPVVEKARVYYNSDDADRFYFHVWGGEDIHVGIYATPEEKIRDASRRTVERITERLSPSGDWKILDIGAGYGGAARYLAETFGCFVECLNLSEIQNQRNRDMNQDAGLTNLISVTDGSFEELPFADATYDAIWSQDAILHSGNREKVLAEVSRVMKPGGTFIFTDPMQSPDCPPGVLQPVLDRIHLATMGSVPFYKQAAADVGLEFLDFEDLTEQLVRHYSRVLEETKVRYEEITGYCSAEYIDRMQAGLSRWIEAGENEYLNWGILRFKKPA